MDGWGERQVVVAETQHPLGAQGLGADHPRPVALAVGRISHPFSEHTLCSRSLQSWGGRLCRG